MSAQAVAARQDDDVIDLDSLNVEQLHVEQQAVKSEIAEITAQIHDATRRETMGDGYYLWRRRAGWALMKKEQERLAIHAVLSVKLPAEKAVRRAQRADEVQQHVEQAKADAAERRALRMAAYGELTVNQQDRKRADEEATRAAKQVARVACDEQAREKRAALLAGVESEGGVDWLLLRVVVAFRHVAGVGNELPETVTVEDRHALKLARVHLRDRIGINALRAAERVRVSEAPQ